MGCWQNPRQSGRVMPEPTPEDTTQSTYVSFESGVGRLKFRFFKDTPQHQTVFLKLLNDSTSSLQLTESVPNLLLRGYVKSRNKQTFLPPETNRLHGNTKGSLCASLKKQEVSDISRFYVVVGGVPFSKALLSDFETQVRLQTGKSDFSFSQANQAKYQQNGGAPWLDAQYTCFAELVEGANTLDALARLKTKGNDAGKSRYHFETPKFAQLKIIKNNP